MLFSRNEMICEMQFLMDLFIFFLVCVTICTLYFSEGFLFLTNFTKVNEVKIIRLLMFFETEKVNLLIILVKLCKENCYGNFGIWEITTKKIFENFTHVSRIKSVNSPTTQISMIKQVY